MPKIAPNTIRFLSKTMSKYKIKINTLKFFIPLLFLFWFYQISAQETLTADEIEQYEKQAKQMVSFLEYTFNTLGNPEISVKEKDIIINQSFGKIFESEEVQIEDDLDENRKIPINKDVQAYLKDIDFFFKNVGFKFDIEEITHQINEKNQLFFKITINRNLSGITIDGDTVNSNRTRYIEINLNDEEKDFKIASIYTTKLNEKEEIRKWWNELPISWKEIFGNDIAFTDTIKLKDVLCFNDSIARLNFMVQKKMCRDTITISFPDTLEVFLSDTSFLNSALIDRQLSKLMKITEINISGITEITSLEPLSRLSGLKKVDCSNTSINSLMPLRNLTHLEMINTSGTAVATLDPLRYSTNLSKLFIDDTWISDINPVSNFRLLQSLHLSKTRVDSISPVSELKELTDLRINDTKINSLEPLADLTHLERLDCSGTNITDLSPIAKLKNLSLIKCRNTSIKSLTPLKNLGNLQLLFIDNTGINDLSPLNGLPELKKIYCDHTGISRKTANEFMEANPGVLVVFESEELKHWWNTMLEAWKNIFEEYVEINHPPTKEDLHKISRIKKLEVSDNPSIKNLEPLVNLTALSELYCQNTNIRSLEPLKDLFDLKMINCSSTQITSLKGLEKLTKLEELWFDDTEVFSIRPIMNLPDLQLVYCDNTPVDNVRIIEFMEKNPEYLIIYQTDELKQWWNRIPEVWQLLAERFIKTEAGLSREQLQTIVNLRHINLTENPEMTKSSYKIESLEYIDKLIFLIEIYFSNTRITTLEPLRNSVTLETLVCPNNPIESVEPVQEITNLTHLDIQNTPVRTLEFLSGLKKLETLKCSGTQIKNLKGLENLDKLKHLDCFNTDIRNLKPIENLPSLKILRCYNTRISLKTIEKFKESHPGCEVIFY